MQGDCLERMKEIPDNSIDLVLIDPPYIGMVKEYWDNKTEEEASLFFLKLDSEIYRICRYGGKLVSFSSNDTLKYLTRTIFKQRELLVVEKDAKAVSAGRNTKKYKQHINHTEFILVCTKYAREYIREILLTANKEMKYSSKYINTVLGCATNGGGMWSIYTGENKCNQVPTKEQWDKFRNLFKNLPCYESFEEVFTNDLNKGNVLKGYNFRMKGRKHPTQKPEELMEYLLRTYSKEGSRVLDCFMGSGTTGVACVNTNRKFIGIEQDEGYFKIAQDRIQKAQEAVSQTEPQQS